LKSSMNTVGVRGYVAGRRRQKRRGYASTSKAHLRRLSYVPWQTTVIQRAPFKWHFNLVYVDPCTMSGQGATSSSRRNGAVECGRNRTRARRRAPTSNTRRRAAPSEHVYNFLRSKREPHGTASRRTLSALNERRTSNGQRAGCATWRQGTGKVAGRTPSLRSVFFYQVGGHSRVKRGGVPTHFWAAEYSRKVLSKDGKGAEIGELCTSQRTLGGASTRRSEAPDTDTRSEIPPTM
jgi:hypothetical protein